MSPKKEKKSSGKSPRPDSSASDMELSPRLQQGSLRRGGVSSEAVTEDDIAKFEKKVKRSGLR